MHWPDIFFKARKPKPGSELPPPFKPAPESAKAASPELQPPTIKPVPKDLPPQGAPSPTPVKIEGGASTPRTLPATHGVVLRPPAGVVSVATIPQGGTAPSPVVSEPSRAAAPIKNTEPSRPEPDPAQTPRRTDKLPAAKSITAEPEKKETKGALIEPALTETKAHPPTDGSFSPNAPAAPLPTSPSPFVPAAISTPAEVKKIEPASKPETQRVSSAPLKSEEKTSDSPPLSKPVDPPTPSPKIIPHSSPSLMPFGSIFRRKAKMTDVARIVLPPKREETETAYVAPEHSPTVVPPAFPVVAMTARANPSSISSQLLKKSSPLAGKDSPAEKSVTEQPEPEPPANIPVAIHDFPSSNNEQGKPAISLTPKSEIVLEKKAEDKVADQAPQTAPSLEKLPETRPEPPPKTDYPLPPIPASDVKPVEPPAPFAEPPKVDPQAHQAKPVATTAPQVDPEAHQPKPVDAPAPKAEVATPRPTPAPASPLPAASTSASTELTTREKREFHLANGERVAGFVLSETPEAVYIEHGTLGVLTIPRSNIAKHLVEIILINGDRIVGDIMAETADTLYVRHASLGMLTIPRAQRSTRVVEAILKDGDRILGEVLTETDTFTVIRSATLGTITVPHAKMAMLNRKIEQIELKALPPPAPEIKDKPPRSDGKN